MIEEVILNLFLKDRHLYEKYYKYINLQYIKNNFTNLYKLFVVLHQHYESSKDEAVSQVDFELVYNSSYLLENSERQELTTILTRIYSLECVKTNAVKYLNDHKKRCIAGELAKIALDVEDGTANAEELTNKMKELDTSVDVKDEIEFVNMDLDYLYETQIQSPGLRWRLPWLNKSLGSLRKGDFGFIFARPETGKTTFLASEITHMLTQTDGDILWFNNEEQGNKVGVRCHQAMLGATIKDLFGNNRKANKEKYEEVTQNRIKILNLEDSGSIQRIEYILNETKPALIIFDQIDKIRGFKADRYDLQLKSLYQWARELAKKHAPVIAVSQAGGSGEGKVWLTMDDVDSSKTAKQGEADWILGIGVEQNNTSNQRFLNISKNKLLGDEDTLPDLRHGNQQVLIKPDIARYIEI